jgi:energy-coupling factor transport system permease protein
MRPLYTFSAQESPLHRLDPRTKLVFLLCYLGITFLLPAPWILFILVMAIIWIFGRIPPSDYYPFLILMLPLIIGITLVHTLFVGDAPYFFTLPIAGDFAFTFSSAGLRSGAVLAFRLATMGVAFTMFAMTTEPFHLGMALYSSGLSYKIAFLFAFALRLYPLIQEEFIVIQNALRARSSNALNSINPFKFFPGLAISAVPLSLGAIRRSQEIALAMEMRGLSIPESTNIKRKLYRTIEIKSADRIVLAISLLALVIIIGLKVTGLV